AAAYAAQHGAVFVAIAGNTAHDLTSDAGLYSFYCKLPTVICVSATGPTAAVSWIGPWAEVDAPAPYSNFGLGVVDVAAPGGSPIIAADGRLGGLVWSACARTSLVIPICQTGIFVHGAVGTSLAAPHVAG